MAQTAGMVQIGNRPLHIALGAGHHNADGGNRFEAELNGRVCQAVVHLARISHGFEVRCYTPGDGLGMHPGPVDAAPRQVAMTWDPVWTVDIFHEIHAQAVPTRPEERGVFVIYPDGAGLVAGYANTEEVDEDMRAHGPVMADMIAAATGLSVGGPNKAGVLSERRSLIGLGGRRLRVFAATATPAMITHTCRFLSEVGCYTNPQDRAIMSQPDFPAREAAGVLRAYASLARVRLGWTYLYRIAGDE